MLWSLDPQVRRLLRRWFHLRLRLVQLRLCHSDRRHHTKTKNTPMHQGRRRRPRINPTIRTMAHCTSIPPLRTTTTKSRRRTEQLLLLHSTTTTLITPRPNRPANFLRTTSRTIRRTTSRSITRTPRTSTHHPGIMPPLERSWRNPTGRIRRK